MFKYCRQAQLNLFPTSYLANISFLCAFNQPSSDTLWPSYMAFFHISQYANTTNPGNIQMETVLQRPNHIYQFIRGDKWKKTSFILLPLFVTRKWSASPPFCASHCKTKKLFSWEELFEIMCVLPVRLTTDLTWLRVTVEMRDWGRARACGVALGSWWE